uniref:hypothetical protein n=1 Tax=uncultured Caulobacter sp. TaxID=158749 RepID=UPI0025E3B2E2|nr:hypothetical protein [uncultured Caulobacter sp.]
MKDLEHFTDPFGSENALAWQPKVEPGFGVRHASEQRKKFQSRIKLRLGETTKPGQSCLNTQDSA